MNGSRCTLGRETCRIRLDPEPQASLSRQARPRVPALPAASWTCSTIAGADRLLLSLHWCLPSEFTPQRQMPSFVFNGLDSVADGPATCRLRPHSASHARLAKARLTRVRLVRNGGLRPAHWHHWPRSAIWSIRQKRPHKPAARAVSGRPRSDTAAEAGTLRMAGSSCSHASTVRKECVRRLGAAAAEPALC